MEVALVLVSLVALAMLGALLYGRRRAAPPPEPATLAEGEVARIIGELRAELAEVQSHALRANNEQFLALAEQRLGKETARGAERLKARQAEIDKSLLGVGDALKEMTAFVQRVDKSRSDSILELATVLKQSRDTIDGLTQVTQNLNQALSGGQARGQWGERMADDILRVAGFIEGVNYRRNRQIEGGATRPDFTFLLPQDRLLHMDVKFPLAGYMRYLEATGEPERAVATKQFLSDVRQRIKEVTGRDYIDPSAGTLDYMLVFIPNEQVYGFIHQHDPEILDDALRRHVVLCSPLTLFAVLAVIRQSVENFRLAERANEILAALGAFNKQWENFKDSMDKVGHRIDQTQKAYAAMRGTRTNVLDREVSKVDELRRRAGIDAAELPEPDAPAELPAPAGARLHGGQPSVIEDD